MATVNVCEIFTSIQGESTYTGFSCFFIRLAGCNLRCRYCDTTYARQGGRDVDVKNIVADCAASATRMAEVTGGEPLLQSGFVELAASLLEATGRPVLVETNGSCDISAVPEGVITVMDIKCPGSGETHAMDMTNIDRLRPNDEVKFVITERADYDWAVSLVENHDLPARCKAVFFSPAFGGLKAQMLGEWILDDGVPVRLQLQIHRLLGMK